jgi:hypothetical protein
VPDRKIELTWVCSSCRHRNLGRHKVCESCGDPKDASEKFEMPGDTASAASVTDPKLLQQASAGRDWRCTFCRADNTALAAACKQCGAQRGSTPAIAPSPRRPMAIAQARSDRGPWLILATIAPIALVVPCVIIGALFFVSASRPATPYVPPVSSVVHAHVEGRTWSTTLVAMRHQLVDQEGFAEAEPADAVDVTPDGERHHHDDQVEDGTEQQTYTEDVPYTDTETYTEMVPCGQDCTTTPQTCHEECTDDGNGFASCHDVCTGGDQTCTPRTCPEQRTRPVQRTRSETRTRTVPHYRTVPRDAPWFHWRAWQWVENRRAHHDGTNEAPSWPTDEELGTGTPLGDGESERVDRDSLASISVRDDRGQPHTLGVQLDDLSRYEVGAPMEVEYDPYGNFSRVLDAVPDGGR